MSQLRLRRVRFKDGRTIEVFRRKDIQTLDANLVQSAARCVESTPEITAFSLVAWDRNGRAFVNYQVSADSPIVAGADSATNQRCSGG